MQYNEAKTVKVGDTLLIKQSNYRSTHVLEITHNSLYHTFRFRCTDGEFYHKELSLPMPNEKLIQKFIQNQEASLRSLCQLFDAEMLPASLHDKKG